jgi:hypothetical protein
MGSPTDYENNLNQKTENINFCVSKSKAFSNNLTIITVQESSSLILTHFSSGDIVSIGRSRNNDIHLSDPYFPSKAAEVILGPLPLLRKMAGIGEKNHSIVPISPGRPFKIQPYTFCLLKTGDIFLNRYKKNHRLKIFVRFVLISISIIISIIFTIYLFFMEHNIENEDLKTTGDHLTTRQSNVSQTGKSIQQEVMKLSGDHHGEVKNIQNGSFEIIKVGNALKTQKSTKEISTNLKGIFVSTNQKNELSSGTQGIPQDEFELLIQTAKSFIINGHPEEAGRTIIPILQHLNMVQESYLIQCLEQDMNSLYQKAYMLMDYDRPAARKDLIKIVQSELCILPSYKKAKSIIESETKVDTILGKQTK